MIKAYHFVEAAGGMAPRMGEIVHAFRTLDDLREFVRMQGKGWGAAHFKFYEIQGTVHQDDGGKDGLEVCVRTCREIRI